MKRGNTAAASTYTGPLGELLVDTGLHTVRVQDGVTAGGMATLATTAQIQALSNSISTITGIDASFVANINTLLSNAASQSVAIGNLQAFETYANATFGTGTFTDANVAAYLPTYGGDISVSNVNLRYGTLTSGVFGPGISLIANVDAGQEFTVMSTGNTSNMGQTLIYTEQNTIGFEITDTNTNNNYNWQFNSTGTTVLPGDIVPSANLTYNLGSPTNQWGNLYVGSDTIYIAGIPLRVDAGGNLTINGDRIGGGAGSGNQLTNGLFTATLDSQGHLAANQFLAAEGLDDGHGYSFYGDGSNDTGMFSQGDGLLEFHNNSIQSANIDQSGNWTFTYPVGISNVYNLSGVIVQNADLEHGATSAVVIPANGTTDPLQVNNFYGTVDITSGVNLGNTKVWTFGTDGQITTPQGGRIGDTYNDGNGIGLSAGPNAGDYAIINSHTGAQYVEASETAVYIGTNYPDTTTVWTFGRDGNVIFPDGSTQTTAWQLHSQNTAPNNGLWYNTDDGRTYLKYNGTWVDANPTVAPAPDYYLGNLTVDGDVVNFTSGNLTIDNTGNLLVNGNLISGSSSATTVDHLTVRNSNDITLDGGSAVWNGSFPGASIFAGFQTDDTVHPALFTFSAASSNTMSVQMDGTLIVGDSMPSNASGISTSNPGWIVAAGGIKLGGDINTLGGIGLTGGITWAGGSQIAEDTGLYLNNSSAVGINSGEAAWVFNNNSTVSWPNNLTVGTATGNALWTTPNATTIAANNGVTIDTQSGDYNWVFGIDGNLTLPSNAAAINYANGQSILSGISSGTNTGNITFSGSDITGTDSNVTITADTTNWIFGNDGELYLPSGGRIGTAGKGWTGIDGGNGNPLSLTGYYASGMYSSCITLSNDGSLAISTYGDGTGLLGSWNFTGANLALPSGSTIGETTGPNGGQAILLTPSGGSAPTQQLKIYPTNAEGNHVHLVSGDLTQTSIFLGSDSQYVRTMTDGSITIGTNVTFPDTAFNGHQWTFDTTGNIIFPDSSVQVTAAQQRVTPPTTSAGQAGDTAGRYAVDSNFYYYCATNWVDQHYSATSNTLYTSDGVWHINKGSYLTPQVGWTITGTTYPYTEGYTTTITSVTDEGGTWGITGAGIANNGVIDSQPVVFFDTTPYPAIWKTIPLTAFGNVEYSDANVAAYLSANPISVSGNLTAGNVVSNNYFFANGNPLISTYLTNNTVTVANLSITGTPPVALTGNVGDTAGMIRVDSNYLYYCTTTWQPSSYTVQWQGSTGNTIFISKGAYPDPQVGWTLAYSTYTFTISAIQTYGGDSSIWQITFIGTGLGSPNGGTATLTNPTPPVIWQRTPLTATSYANANVTAYLRNTITTGNIIPQANVTYTLGNVTNQWQSLYLSSNTIYIGGQSLSVAGGQLALNGNAIGGNYGNANVATYLTSQSITSANIGAYQTYANTAIASLSTNANANTSAYLSAGISGNIKTSANVIATGNVIAGNIIGNQYGNSIGTTATYTGNITAANVIATNTFTVANIVTTGTYGNITGANVISANTFIANGVNLRSKKNVLLNRVQATSTSVTGNANVTAWSSTYTSSGGGVEVTAQFTAFTSGAGLVYFHLQRDGVIVDTAPYYFNNGNMHMVVPTLTYISNAETGSHTYSVRIGSSVSVDTGDYCLMVVTEY